MKFSKVQLFSELGPFLHGLSVDQQIWSAFFLSQLPILRIDQHRSFFKTFDFLKKNMFFSALDSIC